MSDIHEFSSSIVNLAYDGVANIEEGGIELNRRKVAYATALRSLYARHRKHIERASERDLSALEYGETAVGSCTCNALDAGITKLEILAHAQLCFTPEGKP
jgi:hypothetical protein